MHRIRRTSSLTILALFLLWSNLADAQSNVSTGMVQGTVVDSESTPLAGAVVEASDPDTGFKRAGPHRYGRSVRPQSPSIGDL